MKQKAQQREKQEREEEKRHAAGYIPEYWLTAAAFFSLSL
jgi:hypothetical protein